MDAVDRFNEMWSPDVDGCHIWGKGTAGDGYGWFYDQGQERYAHRWIFEWFHGWLPEVVMHHCDKPACVRISCLMPGTIQENNADRHRKGRYRRHRLTEEQVRAIVARSGPWHPIAVEYGVSWHTVARIKRA